MILRPRSVVSACVIVGLGVAIARSGRSDDGTNCDAVEVEYALEANLLLTGTPLGEGNGLHKIGPGKAVVRYEREGRVTVRSCEMRMNFTMHAKTLVWKTTIVTDATAKWSPDACGVVAEGKREGDRVVWIGNARGFRTDGTFDCSGSFCGKFGVPPPGKSELHMAPTPKQLRPFEITPDLDAIKMPYARIAQTTSPQQTSIVAMFGRETRRSCVKPTACR